MTGTVIRLDRAAGGGSVLQTERELPRLDPGYLHELHAGAEDRAAALAFAFALGCPAAAGTVVLARRGGRLGRFAAAPCGDGLVLLGIDPARLVIVDAGGELDVLRAGLEAARCPGVGVVLVEAEGRFAPYDLTASRRLALAAERTGGRVIVLRLGAEPRPSAAQTRWAIASAPSVPLPTTPADAGAPGWPALGVELLRRRGGPAGRRWRLEWDAGHGDFRTTGDGAALSGRVVPLSRGGTDAPGVGSGGSGQSEPRAA